MPIYTLDPAVDGAVIVATGVPGGLLATIVDREGPPPPTSTGEVNAFDAVALDRWDPVAGFASDGLVLATGAGAAALALGVGDRHADVWGPVVVLAEATSVTNLGVEALKHAVARPRPYVSLADDEGVADDVRAALAKPDAGLGFPSGHTAFAATFAFSTASLLTRVHAVPPWAAWTGAGVLTATVGTLRVVAGKHYPTDVLAGAAWGGAVGVLVPVLHTRGLQVSAGPGSVTVAGRL